MSAGKRALNKVQSASKKAEKARLEELNTKKENLQKEQYKLREDLLKKAEARIHKKLSLRKKMTPSQAKDYKAEMAKEVKTIDTIMDKKTKGLEAALDKESKKLIATFNLKKGSIKERKFSKIYSALVDLTKSKDLKSSQKSACKKLIQQADGFYVGIEANSEIDFQSKIKKFVTTANRTLNKNKIDVDLNKCA